VKKAEKIFMPEEVIALATGYGRKESSRGRLPGKHPVMDLDDHELALGEVAIRRRPENYRTADGDHGWPGIRDASDRKS
jgi:hypothetical protein